VSLQDPAFPPASLPASPRRAELSQRLKKRRKMRMKRVRRMAESNTLQEY